MNWGLIGLSLVCGIDRTVRTIYLRLNNRKKFELGEVNENRCWYW